MTRCFLAAGLLVLSAACAAKAPPRPTGPVTPDPSAAGRFQSATAQCRGLSTLTAELALSGRAGDERLRGRVVAGLERGGAARLEGLAPFGAPIFILAAANERARLLLPRDRRVLDDATVSAVLERLTGLTLGADDLRLVLSGCLVESAEPAEGRRWGSGWQAVRVAPERVAYLRERQGVVVVVAADYGPWRVDYDGHAGGWPRTVRVRRDGDVAIDVTARLSQLEINVPIDPRAFALHVPPGMTPMTLDELRSVAPLAPKAP